MIPVLILLAAAQAGALASESSSSDLALGGAQFVELMVQGDFAAAYAQFDPTMKSVLPEEKLRSIWQALQEQAGPFRARLQTRVEKQRGYGVVFVTCQFERTTLDAKVVFDAERRIAGLFFVPSRPAASSFPPPPYARADAYRENDFTVGSGEWSLPGTLTRSVGVTTPVPAVVLVHGSGPSDRDETVLANKPFRDLAWGLATRGIAVLRYEKRTKEYAAKIAAAGISNLTVKEETIDDALRAVAQLRATAGIDPKRIFVLGHSLGGMLAPRIAQADPDLAGLIILEGATMRPLEDLMVEQTRYLISFSVPPSEKAQAKLNAIIEEAAKVKQLTAADASTSTLLLGAPPKYWLDLREHDSLAAAKTLTQPLLIIQGGRDYQVTEADFNDWKKALGSRAGVIFKLYPELNHLLVAGQGKSTPSEYELPGHVDERVIADITNWILNASR